MARRRPFVDIAGYTHHCWECKKSAEWHGEDGKCSVYGISVDKYDSPNNGSSAAARSGCWSYER